VNDELPAPSASAETTTGPALAPGAKKQLLFLIGPRGSGKSTLAPLLAQRLSWNWIDADAELERRCGRSIRDLFAEGGEAEFRDQEAAVLTDLCRLERHIIATGGGVVLRPDNRALLRAAGFAVWLTARPETLAARLQADTTTAERRPSLTGAATDSVQEIVEVLAVRDPLYRACADYLAQTEGRSADELAAEIEGWWKTIAVPRGLGYGELEPF